MTLTNLSCLKKEPEFLYWLCAYPWMNVHIAAKLLSFFHTPKHLFEAANLPDGLLSPSAKKQFLEKKEGWNLSKEYQKLAETSTTMLFFEDKDYPDKLRTIPDPPLCVFYKGTLPSFSTPAIAVIGSRDCSEYGAKIARDLSIALAENHFPLISGMARGIDGLSQQTALAHGGYSLGILGSGCDICYPTSNKLLYQELIDKGGILSTYIPGTHPLPMFFPMRNRIVSGLCDGLVVVEARQKSGTLITVDMALEQGREIYAVPGRITDRLSDGCNGLIGQGANIYLSPDIFIHEMLELVNEQIVQTNPKPFPIDSHPQASELTEKQKRRRNYTGKENIPDGLSLEEQQIYNYLPYTPISIEELLEKLPDDHTLLEVQMLLMQLILQGYAVQNSSGSFSRV